MCPILSYQNIATLTPIYLIPIFQLFRKKNCFVEIKKLDLKLVNRLTTFPLLQRNNVHEDFLVILQFDWLSKTLFTLCRQSLLSLHGSRRNEKNLT